MLPSEFSGLEDVTTSMATVIGIFYEVMEEEDKKIRTGSYTHQEIQVKNEKITQTVNTDEELSKMLEEETIEEEKIEKENGVMKAIKNWFSNFI